MDAKDITESIASEAEAKLGFPNVPIIELYGLFQETKSFPVNWSKQYVERIKLLIIDIL
jgi:hypothetical protein